MTKNPFFSKLRLFFKWLVELFRIWFTPYHIDDEEEEGSEEPTKTPGAKAQAAPKSAEPAQTASAAAAAPASGANASAETTEYADDYSYEHGTPNEPEPGVGAAAVSAEAGEGTFNQYEVIDTIAFRGPTMPRSLADALNATTEGITQALEVLQEENLVEKMSDGRYLVTEAERRRVLKEHSQVAKWLAGLDSEDLVEKTLEVIEQVCRQFPIKLLAGKDLVFHIHQRKWMTWHSHEKTCTVKVYGTPSSEQWEAIRRLDKRARIFRIRGEHDWDLRDWLIFRWRASHDAMAVEAEILDLGRAFQRQTRGSKKKGRRHSTAVPQESSDPQI